MDTVTKAELVAKFHAQVRSTDFWVNQWEKYKDMSGVRNASMAIGKLFGIAQVLGLLGIPEDVADLCEKYQEIWDNLKLGESGIRIVVAEQEMEKRG